jgi:hypothetical protein
MLAIGDNLSRRREIGIPIRKLNMSGFSLPLPSS